MYGGIVYVWCIQHQQQQQQQALKTFDGDNDEGWVMNVQQVKDYINLHIDDDVREMPEDPTCTTTSRHLVYIVTPLEQV